MENKQLLDRNGNVITKEIIEEKLRKIYEEEPMRPLLEKCEWEEAGEIYHTWKINIPGGPGRRATVGYTNDAGAAQINKAIEDWVKKEYEKEN
jgi:hypothetical protein